jgi:hypothetical protein
VLFVRDEDLISSPRTALQRKSEFVKADVPAVALGECVRRQETCSRYAQNPYNDYLYTPAKGSIYDVLG